MAYAPAPVPPNANPSPRADVSRRRFLRMAGLGAVLAPAMLRMQTVHAMSEPASRSAGTGPVTQVDLPPLPYAYDALAPNIDERTMRIHHDRHHAGYTRKYNDALKEISYNGDPVSLLTDLPAQPESARRALRNNGGGWYNHDLFWKIMAPSNNGGGGHPEGALANAIQRDFGSYASFKETFSEAAGSRFGSGWAWLIIKPSGRLAVVSTANQDNPLMRGIVDNDKLGQPILGIDVWEHAYYLKYQNKRGEYIENWWNVVNWPEVAHRYNLHQQSS